MEDKFIGKRLDSRYEIHELLGMGGMAYVYKAYDRIEDRWVAIKILKEEFSNNSEFLRRFRNESKAIAVLSHPNIVKIFDVSFGDQIQYIVMEYVNGITLKDYIDQQGAIRWKEVLHFLVQILDALDSAHAKGIIHRDIKPQNILLLRDGEIKVTDFGIARFLQSETQTVTDKAIGSVHYISPEQARGDYITDKADIYSTGVMMYEMLTGELPFVADNAVSVALMQLQTKPRMAREINPDIPVGLEQITMKAMEKNPVNRFRSVRAMIDDIHEFKINPNTLFGYTFTSSNYAPLSKTVDNYETGGFDANYNDNYEYEEELIRSKRRRKGTMIITGALVALIAVGVIVGAVYLINMWKTMQNPEDNTTLVPNFVGKIYVTDIQGNPEYDDFKIEIREGNNPDKQPGEVLLQNPNAGMTVRKGREVILTVNKGEGILVPLIDLKGYEQTKAIEALSNLKLEYKVENIADDEIEIGHVVKTDPAAGSDIPEGSVVTLYVSKGPQNKKVTIPDGLIGMKLNDVTVKLDDLNLQYTVVEDDESEKQRDTVIWVFPESGATISEGSSVEITISSGKGAARSIAFEIPLPTYITEDLNMKVYENGSVILNDTVNPAYARSYGITFKGKRTDGTSDIVVNLGGIDYLFGKVDYDAGTANITQQIDYPMPKTPEPEPEPEPTYVPEEDDMENFGDE
jgi:Serine/threonine protein kinase